MSELMLQIISFLKILVVAGVGLLYGLGGMSGKWKRRFVAPAVIVGAVCGFSAWQGTFSWLYLISYFLYAGAFSIGYGVNSSLTKFFKNKFAVRAVAGALVALASLPIAIVNSAYILFGLHLNICILVNIILGAINPVEAREEETILGTTSALLPLFMI